MWIVICASSPVFFTVMTVWAYPDQFRRGYCASIFVIQEYYNILIARIAITHIVIAQLTLTYTIKLSDPAGPCAADGGAHT